MELSALEKAIGYTFRDIEILRVATTHSSYANEVKHQVKFNERLEFLGDAVLSIIVSDHLFHRSGSQEGELTKMRAALVCEKSLKLFADKIELGQYLQLGKGEEMTGGRTRPSILADAFEAVIAAIYLDGGLEAARSFVLPFVDEMLKDSSKVSFKDYKTLLQEIIQKNPEEHLSYHLVDQWGPDHDKHFVVEIHLNSNVIGRGEGKSKKNAEQVAAKQALELMGK
ncbi:MAG: ribonuclease III [Oscillospiraceae bacterium]|nr:ribonuclease III [Oscillospiraceae bacterium]